MVNYNMFFSVLFILNVMNVYGEEPHWDINALLGMLNPASDKIPAECVKCEPDYLTCANQLTCQSKEPGQVPSDKNKCDLCVENYDNCLLKYNCKK